MLEFAHLTKLYPDGTRAVDDFSLTVDKGEFVTLIGPSGCGKSTTLRMINRLVEPTSGTILLDGKDYRTQNAVQLRRRLGYVVQQIGLMPHFTIAENISFVLRLNGVKPKRRRDRAAELLQLARMDPDLYLDKFPRELSGGQQQRIGVLRALAHDPDIILMDEPFGALDPITREQLQDELKNLQRRVQKTILFVTHDMDEALRLADRIVIMREGQIVQAETPEEILRHPADDFVASFIGQQRMLRQAGEVSVRDIMSENAATISSEQGLAQALEFMRRRKVDTLMVETPDKKFMGIARLRDIQQAFEANHTVRIGTLAVFADAAVSVDDPALRAIHQMMSFKLDAIPVLDASGHVASVVTRGSLVGVLAGALGIEGETGPAPAKHA
ncbi:betaine/proline/choline family ABC transporter ATP-binding protein [Alicyclobacillus tolerans]|uniref:ABC transporter ATP-binding protein n=1 Tax=Alicyclobacillus tolerans TaxID=90970 RepID=UPI001EED813A|nr:betaine/proline/choline family ABC transporter ATP-binding protein [Alicyclobacillus tolerans]MCF8566744.1 betaine/proline/choline family ABC transporter ATP-binding protein [Alicyclobacillus tolerans]